MSDLAATTTRQTKREPAKAEPKKAKPLKRLNGSVARLRYSGDLPPVGSGEQPFAKCRAELHGFTEGEITRLIVQSNAWREVMKPILDELDRERFRPGKEQPLYTSEELESVLLFQRVAGEPTCAGARRLLAGDDSEARRVLGFAHPRMAKRRPRRVLRLRDGVPSEATLARHRARFGRERRLKAWQALERRFLEEHLATPELAEEARVLYCDGTVIQTHFTAPKYDPKTKKLINPELVTAPDAGYRGKSAGEGRSGSGWNLIAVVTRTGVPVVPSSIIKIHEDECGAAEKLLEQDFQQITAPIIGSERLCVLNADMAFADQPLREAARRVGIIENIHGASHAKKDTSVRRARELNAFEHAIKGYPKWRANGHREIRCVCGECRTSRRIFVRNGKTVARLEGFCAKCGSITITSGEWVVKKPGKAGGRYYFARRDPRQDEQPDYSFGNPLTFNDPVAASYGIKRWSRGEGFNGTVSTRFGLNEKRWLRWQAEVETDAAIIFSIIHAVSLEQRRRVRAAAQAPPRTLACAA